MPNIPYPAASLDPANVRRVSTHANDDDTVTTRWLFRNGCSVTTVFHEHEEWGNAWYEVHVYPGETPPWWLDGFDADAPQITNVTYPQVCSSTMVDIVARVSSLHCGESVVL